MSRPPAGVGRWIKEPYCGLSHAFGAVAALIGVTTLLLTTTGGPSAYVGLCIYGAAAVALFAASATVHSLHVAPEIEARLDRLDHAAIFFLIAGTYAPICLTVLRGPWGTTIVSIEAVIAVLGAVLVLFTRVSLTLIAPLYVPMGWLIVVATRPLLERAPPGVIAWLIGGGAIYTIGAVVYITKRPKLWPGRFGYHDLWHTMVLAGAACHFAAIALATR